MDIPYLFDRYYQVVNNTNHIYEGLGIGLSLAKEIVSAHEGELTVRSEEHIGTTFSISMPYQLLDNNFIDNHKNSEELETKYELWKDLWEKTYQPIEKITLEKRNKEQTILLVDDHPEVREYISQFINDEYNIIEAENGLKALEILKEHAVHLVITDLMMPWMDGFELLENIKSNELLKSIPVLVISARNTENDQFEVLNRGINNIIQKPIRKEDLLQRIGNLLIQKNNWKDQGDNSLLVDDKLLMNDIEKELLEKVKSLILKQIDNSNLSVLTLADAMAASERKVYRMIKKLTNHTPHEYIKEIRWQYINKLIAQKTFKNPTEAANSIGMKNVTNFKRQFHKRFNKNIEDLIN